MKKKIHLESDFSQLEVTLGVFIWDTEYLEKIFSNLPSLEIYTYRLQKKILSLILRRIFSSVGITKS